MERQAFSITEVANVPGVHHTTIRNMIRKGELPAVRVGRGKGKFLVPRYALDGLLGSALRAA